MMDNIQESRRALDFIQNDSFVPAFLSLNFPFERFWFAQIFLKDET